MASFLDYAVKDGPVYLMSVSSLATAESFGDDFEVCTAEVGRQRIEDSRARDA